jgi:hypothetical protein
MVPHGNAAVVKRTLRPVVKAVAALAGVVFLFDNHLSGTSGLILLASIAGAGTLRNRVDDFPA